MTYLIGIAGGFISGFFGAGGGLILLPALVNFLKVDEYKARGTTIASILVAILVASIFYSKNNFFDFGLSVKIAIGGVVGGYIGAKIMKKIPPKYLAIIFDVFLICVSAKMIIGG